MSYAKILVPVAPDHGPEAARAIEVARSMLAPGGTITVLGVIEDMPRYLAAEAAVVYPDLEVTHQAVSAALTDRFSAPDQLVVVAHGSPTRTILEHARREGHDCIVIPSTHRGWGSYFIGSTASGVVRHAHCSVHVLRGVEAEVPEADAPTTTESASSGSTTQDMEPASV